MEIRELRSDEGLAFRDVRLRALRLAPEAFATSYDEQATQPDAFWIDLAARGAAAMGATTFVIDRGDGALAGTAYVRVSEDPPHDTYIGAMWVDEDLRGEGWAGALLEAAERYAIPFGATAVELWVEAENTRARRFYASHGYALAAVQQPTPQGGTALLMRKEVGGY